MKEFKWQIFQDFRHVKLSGALTALYSNKIIQQVSAGLVGIFFPVFLYQKLGSFEKTILYFIISYGIWLFLIPLGARLMTCFGIKKSLIISVIFGAIYYFMLGRFEVTNDLYYLGLVIVAMNIDRMFYVIQYHTDFAKFTNKPNRGKQMSFLLVIGSLVSIALPFLSGQILENYNFSILFTIAFSIYLVSALPLFLIPEKKEAFSYGYFETYKKVFSQKRRRMFFSYAADGAQSIVGAAFWPLFIWLILDKSYTAAGLVSSLVIFASIILRLIMGDLTDRINKKKLLKIGTWLFAVGWSIKMFVATGLQIFFASTYHDFANIVMRTPYDALMYERAADSGKMVDEYAVVREVEFTIGRVIMCLLVLGLVFATGNLALAFLGAGVISLLINLI